MIESVYWKEDLLKLANDLPKKCKIKRYSEKHQVVLEKRIILCFFIIRKLMELQTKLSKKIYDHKSEIVRYPTKTDARITKMNDAFIEDHYQLDKPESLKVGINFIANQLIHHEIVFLLLNENRIYDRIIACSDYEQDKYLYEISINSIIEILEIVGNDSVFRIELLFDEKKNDYKVICT